MFKSNSLPSAVILGLLAFLSLKGLAAPHPDAPIQRLVADLKPSQMTGTGAAVSDVPIASIVAGEDILGVTFDTGRMHVSQTLSPPRSLPACSLSDSTRELNIAVNLDRSVYRLSVWGQVKPAVFAEATDGTKQVAARMTLLNGENEVLGRSRRRAQSGFAELARFRFRTEADGQHKLTLKLEPPLCPLQICRVRIHAVPLGTLELEKNERSSLHAAELAALLAKGKAEKAANEALRALNINDHATLAKALQLIPRAVDFLDPSPEAEARVKTLAALPRQLRHLAEGFAATGNPLFRDSAVLLLYGLAQEFPLYDGHFQGQRPGKCFEYQDAIVALDLLAPAFASLSADALATIPPNNSNDVWRTVLDGFLEPAVWAQLRPPYASRDHSVYLPNAMTVMRVADASENRDALLPVVFALGKVASEHVERREEGYGRRLYEGGDGFDESLNGTMYTRYGGFAPTPTESSGRNLWKFLELAYSHPDERVRKRFDLLSQKRFPAFGDQPRFWREHVILGKWVPTIGWSSTYTASADLANLARAIGGYLEFLFRQRPDPLLAAFRTRLVAAVSAPQIAAELKDAIHAAAATCKEPLFSSQSRVLGGLAVAILQHPGSEHALYLKAGRHHGPENYDDLALAIYDKERPLVPNLGKKMYYSNLHPTVEINNISQRFGWGAIRSMIDAGNTQFADAWHNCGIYNSDVYERQVLYAAEPTVGDAPVILDVFRVKGGKSHTMAWPGPNGSIAKTSIVCAPWDGTFLYKTSDYQKGRAESGSIRVDYQHPESGDELLRIQTWCEQPRDILSARHRHRNADMPFVYHQTGQPIAKENKTVKTHTAFPPVNGTHETVFVSVLETKPQRSALKITPVPVVEDVATSVERTVAMRLQYGNGISEVLIMSTGKQLVGVPSLQLAFKGKAARVRLEANGIERITLLEPSMCRIADGAYHKFSPRWEAEVVATDYNARTVDVRSDQALPSFDSLPPIRFRNRLGTDTMYAVDAVEQVAENVYRLTLKYNSRIYMGTVTGTTGAVLSCAYPMYSQMRNYRKETTQPKAVNGAIRAYDGASLVNERGDFLGKIIEPLDLKQMRIDRPIQMTSVADVDGDGKASVFLHEYGLGDTAVIALSHELDLKEP